MSDEADVYKPYAQIALLKKQKIESDPMMDIFMAQVNKDPRSDVFQERINKYKQKEDND